MVDTDLFGKLMFEDSSLCCIPYWSYIGITIEHTSPTGY